MIKKLNKNAKGSTEGRGRDKTIFKLVRSTKIIDEMMCGLGPTDVRALV